MAKTVLVVSGCDVLEGVPIVVKVIDHQTLLLGVLVAAYLAHHLGGLA